MIDDQLTPDEEKTIQQIQAAGRPTLDPGARDAIRQQMLSEFRALPNAATDPSSPAPLPQGARGENTGEFANNIFQRSRIPVRVIFAAAAIIVIIGFIGFFLANQPRGTIIATPTSNQVAVVPSETPIAASETPTESQILAPATETAIVMAATPIPPTIPPSTETNTPMIPTATLETVLIIEGPVTNIVDNVVTVYGYNIEIEPQHPILSVIEVGDVVRVQGVVGSDGRVVASVLGNLSSDTVVSAGEPTVGLDGPVESIDKNIIVVNDISVQLAPDDPLLQTIQVGNFVRVQGNFETSGSTIVLVVVNIVVINNVTTIENECSYHEDAMGMGHWHCDGMGMGSAMGMGDDAMGMGDNGMGMGNNGMGMGMGEEDDDDN